MRMMEVLCTQRCTYTELYQATTYAYITIVVRCAMYYYYYYMQVLCAPGRSGGGWVVERALTKPEASRGCRPRRKKQLRPEK